MKNSESVLQSIDDKFKVNDPENKVLQFIRQQYPEINLEDFAPILQLIGQHYQQILQDKDQELEKCYEEISFLKEEIDKEKKKIYQQFTEKYTLAIKEIEDKYKAQLEAEDQNLILEREQYHKEIIFLRKMVEELSQRPQVINISIDKNQEINQP